jgi:hypothetical protein
VMAKRGVKGVEMRLGTRVSFWRNRWMQSVIDVEGGWWVGEL